MRDGEWALRTYDGNDIKANWLVQTINAKILSSSKAEVFHLFSINRLMCWSEVFVGAGFHLNKDNFAKAFGNDVEF